jgi:uncharacterized ferredoxin-like protein
MIFDSRACEQAAVMETAHRMCAAARTAPKARGLDYVETAVVVSEQKNRLADEMDRLSVELKAPFFARDAKSVRDSQAVVLIGTRFSQRGLNDGYCGFDTCRECAEAGATCVYDPMDQGIALGSAVSIAADNRVDNRVLYSAGRAALSLKMLDESVRMIMAVPLSVAGKSPFFDRR